MVEGIGGGPRGVVRQVGREVAACAGRVDQCGRDVRPAIGQCFGDGLAELREGFAVTLSTGRVNNQLGALSHQPGKGFQLGRERWPVHHLIIKNHVLAAEPFGVIDSLEHCPQEGQVGRINHQQPALALAPGNPHRVIAETQTQQYDTSRLRVVDGAHEVLGFLLRGIAAG